MSGITDGYAALGIKRPESPTAETGAKAQAPADPAETGAKAQEPAAPATGTKEKSDSEIAAAAAAADGADTDNADNDGASAESGAEGEKRPLTKEERARNAERRREAETQARIDAAIAEERRNRNSEIEKARDEAVAALRITNPYTQKTITTRAELDEFVKARDEQRIKEGLSKAGIERDTLEALINEHPDVVKARQLSEEATRVLDKESEKTLEARLEEIREFNPAIRTEKDLRALPEYPDIHRLVKGGLTISEAYFNIHRKEILEKERKAGTQAALNSITSKQHLQGDTQHGAATPQLPKEVEKGYRALYGNLSPAEMQKKYEQTQKYQKG